MIELVRFLVTELVSKPDDVEIRQAEDDPTVITVSVASEDLGKVIGRKGRTVRALRTLLGFYAHRHGTEATLELLEDDEEQATSDELHEESQDA